MYIWANIYRIWTFRSRSGGRLNIKMPSYQYRDSHVKDKTVSPTVLSLTWESPYPGKTVFILRRGPVFCKNGFKWIQIYSTHNRTGRLLWGKKTARYWDFTIWVIDGWVKYWNYDIVLLVEKSAVVDISNRKIVSIQYALSVCKFIPIMQGRSALINSPP